MLMTNDQLLKLAEDIEKSNGLLKVVPGQGTIQLGIKATATIIQVLREVAKCPTQN